MSTALYSHPVCVEHDPGTHHPERPDRLRAVLKALEAEAFDDLVRIPAPKASLAQIERVHAPYYVEKVFENIPESGLFHLDPDTAMSPKSGEAALRAAGGVCAAVDAVIGGQTTNAFCALRPPGHHAEPSQAMGFCLFNNIAIGALQARDAHGIERVAVVDFDVHHGNGTQASFERYRDFLYVSSHQSPAYPGTGAEMERGLNNNIINVELDPGSGSDIFRKAYTDRILPALRDWKPQLLMISAGFDAHLRDPLAQLLLHDDDFAWVSRQLLEVAAEVCENRVVSVLEGGYDLDALAACVALHVGELMAVDIR
ncbi:MAG: histone deacetylase family protein [Rhodospirillaceae bacterium]|nr:histone deacetylase family protein [Rhodospirillaceae bacterium]MBL6941558.1 histone deacetylase family protein [Rhodospirillales bacterium]